MLDVEYIGWNVFGVAVHCVDGSGAKFIWANPFDALAVMLPERWVEWSRSPTTRPCGLSLMVTPMWSPWFMSSTSGVGVNVAAVESSGFGGATGLPSLVTNAKLSNSTPPTCDWQAVLSA